MVDIVDFEAGRMVQMGELFFGFPVGKDPGDTKEWMGLGRRFIPFLFIFLCFLAGCGRPTSYSYGGLAGYVLATNGGVAKMEVRGLLEDLEDDTLVPLPGAVVSILNTGLPSAVTDANGYFFFPKVRTGTYTVTIAKGGYETLRVEGVVIHEGEVTPLFSDLAFAQKKWNFLVYMDGDNNLDDCAILDLNEMELVGSTKDVNILVLIDRSSLADDWTDTRLYYVTKNTDMNAIGSTLLSEPGELDMSDPATLRDFIIYCHRHFPAERTCLTIWNHGDGVYPKSVRSGGKTLGGTPPAAELKGGLRGICWDDSSTVSFPWNCLTTDEVAQALAEARLATGKKIDVINLDACLMQMLEVAYEWRNEANYLVGSQAVVPGLGNNYDVVLGHLVANPSMSAYSLAKTLVDDYANTYAGSEDTTYSALSLGTEFTGLMNAFSAFATALRNTTDMAGVVNAWVNTTAFACYEYNDLYDFATQLLLCSSDQGVKKAAMGLRTALSAAIVHHRETGAYLKYAHGLSILLPSYYEWSAYSGSNQYVTLALAGATDWDEFITAFVNYTSGAPPSYTMQVKLTWSAKDCDLVIIEPDGNEYWVAEGSSPNGVFSADQTNGGTETWTLNQPHDPGIYIPCVYSWDYTGYVTVTVVVNGMIDSVSFLIKPGEGYSIDSYLIRGKPELQVRLKDLHPRAKSLR